MRSPWLPLIIGLVLVVLWMPFVLAPGALHIYKALGLASFHSLQPILLAIYAVGAILSILVFGLAVRNARRRAGAVGLSVAGIILGVWSIANWVLMPLLNPAYYLGWK
ncbi:MAG TPA: hypothetical protein VFI02_15660 [Armatimonadota bacterium]|nr:hypothetical protein [Armatimonadota bacterium]